MPARSEKKKPEKKQNIRAMLKRSFPDPPPAHYSVELAAWHLGMSPRWIRDEIKAGRLEGFLFGNKVVVSLESMITRLEIARVTGRAIADANVEDEAETDLGH